MNGLIRLSVRPSVRPSLRLSHLFDRVPIIGSPSCFQNLLPWSKVMSMQKVKVIAQRSRSQGSNQIWINLGRFRMITPARIHGSQPNFIHRFSRHRGGSLLFLKVIQRISRSHGPKKCRFGPDLAKFGCFRMITPARIYGSQSNFIHRL